MGIFTSNPTETVTISLKAIPKASVFCMLCEVQGLVYPVSALALEPAAPPFMTVALTLAQEHHKKCRSEAKENYLDRITI